ncbi:MAG: hypothetical protein NTV54_12010 [Ignavibacteriales bacterium]|nr:hypothetical protein [Ignavibacteriales bacterium]
MKPALAKYSLLVLCIAAIVWLGAVNVRAIIGFELLHTGTLEFITTLDPPVEREIMHLVSYASLAVDAGYAVSFLSAIVFLWSSPLVVKREGWLLMSAMLFFGFAPVEFYAVYLDLKFAWIELFSGPDAETLRALFLKRLTALAGAPMVALLCYYTIIPLTIWQPMKKEERA